MVITCVSAASTRFIWHGFVSRLSSLHCNSYHSYLFHARSPPPLLYPFVSRNSRAFPRLFACAADSAEDPKRDIPGRMPLEPEPRPKPKTAVAVVEQYTEKLWRDFFTRPHQWMDNRLRKRAPKYADFKHKLTKEGLWINTKWNPPWVRVELSLMTHFKPVPLDDPRYADKKVDGDGGEKETSSADAQSKPVNRVAQGVTPGTRDVWRRSDSQGGSSSTPNQGDSSSAPAGTGPRV